jgi:hypothetical protein
MPFNPNELPPGRMLFPTPTYFDESQFFGRADDVERVRQLLDAGSSVAVSGKRRIGRSWFLQHLRSALPPERYLVVYSDELTPDTIFPRQARLFLSALVYALHAALRPSVQAGDLAPEKSPRYPYLVELRGILDEYFGEEDLKTLCFDLGVEYDDLPALGRAHKARELIVYMGRCGRLAELVKMGIKLRPNAVWREPPPQYLPADQGCLLLDPANPPPNVGQAFRGDLAALQQSLVTAGRTAVILLDEAEALLQFTDEAGIVPAIVRSLATKYQCMRVIVAGFDLRSPIGSHPALFDAFAHHQLFGIGSQGAHDLIVGQLAGYGVAFDSPDTWEQIAFLTGEEPALLRFLAQQLVEQARHNDAVIGAEQVQAAVEDFFATPEVGSNMNYLWAFLGQNQPIHALVTALAYNHALDAGDQVLLINEITAQFYAGRPPEAIQGDLRRLCTLGFLCQREDSASLQFSSDLLRQWICRHRPNPGLQL